MAGAENDPIIIKRKKVAAHGHHGGAWKVAYADFVTAMMAFFLLMWLLNATTEEARSGLADYFSPALPLSERSAGGDSVFNGESVFSSDQQLRDGSGGVEENNEDGENESRGPTELESAAERLAVLAQEAITVEPLAGPDAVDPSGGGVTDGGSAAQDPSEMTDAELEEAYQEQLERDRQRVEAAFSAIEQSEEGDFLLEHLMVRMTPEGLMIEIVDTEGDPLFGSGSTDASDTMRAIIEVVAPIIGALENRIAIIGHTDGRPYSAGSAYTNWELSADRANAARRLLEEFGLPPERLARVTGAADRDPIADNVLAPENRRIGITLLRERPESPSANTQP